MDGTLRIKYLFSDKIQESWSEYDRVVAQIHLQRFGKVFLDEFDLPIDNEFILDDLENALKAK